MILWDKEMKRLKVRARLRALEPRAILAWATDVLEHALEIALTPKLAKSADAKVVRQAIEASRRHLDGKPAKLGDLADRIADRLPDEDDEPPAGIADLLDGALALCELIETPRADAAFGIASYAYQAVLARFIDREAASGGEADHRKAELATPECLREIEHQGARLDALES